MKWLGRLFSHSMREENGDPVSLIWIGNRSRSVLMNPDSTRVSASLSHDGHGKFYPTVYASLFDTVRISRHEPIGSFGLRSFPRLTLWPFRYKCSSMAVAQECLQEYLVEMRMI
jgi:hypothetical protein